ncbi:hypothetical protein EJ04DRAFT_510144 [Polyplosphaeria fusca]|uniref:Uncharacterized protein n=1 Tax=Polyplosphaeria fusca TaxID=682080 RepID=A0A9P4V6T0_9PLEO|nr:hypothetical protein EJ04DRAFT_510144 [Polyplosphaeria fusca]
MACRPIGARLHFMQHLHNEEPSRAPPPSQGPLKPPNSLERRRPRTSARPHVLLPHLHDVYSHIPGTGTRPASF